MAFQRCYIQQSAFFQIKKFNQSSIVIGQIIYPQTLPIFWNSNGISSENSFQTVSQELEVNGDENENDELEDILTNGNNSFIVNTQKNSYVIEDNLITKILPQTNVYLFLYNLQFNGKFYDEIQDISEEVQKYADFPKFNYNLQQRDQYNKIMSYRDPFSENEQKIEYVYQIKLKYGQFIQKLYQQENKTSLYLTYTSNFVVISQINDGDTISFILSFAFSLLIFRRSKKRKEIRAQTEDLIYKQVIQISRQEFQKKYELNYRDSIGCGSFGQVYKVKNKYKQIIKNPDILQNMPDYYACKQIHISQDGENQSQQIFHEIEVLEKLKKYEYVIKLQNYIIEERSAYLVLDLAESTLQDKINEKQANSEKFDESEIVKFLSQIGKTLALIYIEEGIAHRDIKPSNILIKDDNFYLSDFGCAEILFESQEARNNLVMGTLKWMSPELKEMKKNQVVDYFKSDIFSLGMLLLYMLTLSDISSVNSDEFTKNQKIRIMKNYCKGISNEIILLIKRMLETNPDNRPDAAIIINAIQDIENNFKQKNLSKDL
ncbi:kinase domain protein (macronuclear) [Tetrahymena thermophila SB210]|uniref:non-specific serine/threonine protein kinase n=1 Tax=Tetrahymena thermophila (strain SB210) TaxID=312017 RepID=Q238Y1_TETTS|nr:kinase domain protein [Tetrahymena thermophila SB210]EAR93089.3 kinase domain protein [Tetrahymena thermophila SB210]|eukprot:XP_001013334.3 kinase domain protein [Tetrahymena thermophila SB210]